MTSAATLQPGLDRRACDLNRGGPRHSNDGYPVVGGARRSLPEPDITRALSRSSSVTAREESQVSVGQDAFRSVGGPSRMSPQQTARPRQGRTFWSADRAHRRRRGTSRCSNDRPAGARVQVLERLSVPPSMRDNRPYPTPAPGPVALSAGCGTDECQRFFQLFLGARRASTRLFAFEPTGWNKFAALPLYYSPNEWEAAAELALERGQRADVRAEIKTDAGQAAVIVEFGAADRRSLDALHEHAAVTARSGRTVRRRHRVWLLNREIAPEHARSVQTALASRLGVRRDQRPDVPVPGTLEHHPAPPRIRRLVVVSGAFHDPDALDAE